MIDALGWLGYGKQVGSALDADAEDVSAGHELLPRGKAYRHGWEKGRTETFEIMGVP